MRVKCIERTSKYDCKEHFIPGRYYRYVDGILGPSECGNYWHENNSIYKSHGGVFKWLEPWYIFTKPRKNFNGLEEEK